MRFQSVDPSVFGELLLVHTPASIVIKVFGLIVTLHRCFSFHDVELSLRSVNQLVLPLFFVAGVCVDFDAEEILRWVQHRV